MNGVYRALGTADTVQTGAREHYMIPRIFHSLGLLRWFYTDCYCGPGSWLESLSLVPDPVLRLAHLASLAGRRSDLPASKVRAANLLGLSALARLRFTRSTYEKTLAHHSFRRRLFERVRRATRTPADVVVGLRGADLLFDCFKGKSLCVLWQNDGGLHEVEVVRDEQERHRDWVPGRPDWDVEDGSKRPAWMDLEEPRLMREWALADLIICNSAWTMQCLRASGVPAEKLRRIPPCYEIPASAPAVAPAARPPGGPLRVGFLGGLSIRKGVHLLLDASRRANAEMPLQVVLAGPCEVAEERLREFAGVAVWRGALPRTAVPSFLADVDVLCLPSISEGFGIVQLEAMAAGLPVIASDRTGEVVRDGEDGFRVPAGDVDALADRLVRMGRDPALRRRMGMAARERVMDFDMARIARLWLAELHRVWESAHEQAVGEMRKADARHHGAVRPSVRAPDAAGARSSSFSTVDIVQIGVRRHYAVPLMAESLGLLRTFHTDAYCGPGSLLYPWRGALGLFRAFPAVRKLVERTSALPAMKVRAHNTLGFASKWRMLRAAQTMDRMHVHHDLAARLNAAVVRSTPSPADITYGFRGVDSLFAALQGRTLCVLDQIDGGIREVQLMRAEQAAHREWLSGEPDWKVCERTGAPWWLDIEAARLRREWELADHIVCNSEWTRRCLVAEGVPDAKCSVVPLSYLPPCLAPAESERAADGPLRIAFLGSLTLRKGIHHALEAARRAARMVPVRVVIAGPAGDVRPERVRQYDDVADFRGVLPRGEVPAFLRSCGVLALPSISEGFGIVQLEAMAQGLPVIASDRTGEVVRDGVDGFQVPAGDVDALADRFVRLARDPALRRRMGMAARERVKDFAPEHVARQWLAVLGKAWNIKLLSIQIMP